MKEQPIAYGTSKDGRLIIPIYGTTLVFMAGIVLFGMMWAVVVGGATVLFGRYGHAIAQPAMFIFTMWCIVKVWRRFVK